MHSSTAWCLVLALPACACGDSGRETASESVGTTVTTPSTMPTSAPTGDTGTPVTTSESGGSNSATEGTSEPTSTSAATGTSVTTVTTDQTTGFKFDMGGDTGTTGTPETTGEPVDLCKVQDDMNAIGECDKEAPPNSFEPEIQWAWTGPNGDSFSIVTPLVANLTDDNADGAIDLCDIPDVVVVASPSSGVPGGRRAHLRARRPHRHLALSDRGGGRSYGHAGAR